MSRITWDNIGSRTYESGVDRGVLYLPGGSGVPWNGLTSVIETFDRSVKAIYYDGMKVNDLVELGSFAGKMKAITYPDEFLDFEGISRLSTGVYASDQRPKTFGLSYRTMQGDDVGGPAVGYKIHLIYNLTAIPADRANESIGESLNVDIFEWDITAVPEEFEGFRPTAHYIIDSTQIDPLFLEQLEDTLYGSDSEVASLPLMSDMVEFITTWARLMITNNGDGTWTAEEMIDGTFIEMLSADEFQITDANAIYYDASKYSIRNT